MNHRTGDSIGSKPEGMDKRGIRLTEVARFLRLIIVSPWVCFVLRLGLAFLFIYGGFTKLMDPRAFAKLISAYDLVPEMLLPVVAVGLPLLETVAGIGLAFDVKGSLSVITGLLVLFILVLWYGVVNDLSIDCGCFGAEELAGQQSLRQAFYRDMGLIGAAAFLYVAKRRTGAPSWQPHREQIKKYGGQE